MTETNRRHFLKRSAMAAAAITLPLPGYGSLPGKPVFASAFTNSNGQHYIGLVDENGTLVFQHRVPGRGHAACASSCGRYLAFMARRPRRWMVIIDPIKKVVVSQTESTEGRHFYGHAVFSQDNNLLFTTENAYATGEGMIGIYDVKHSLKRLGEIPSFGVGPHELALLSDGKTLAVANGGIQTHPDYGRIKLNLDTMASRLTYVDIASAKELASYGVNNQKLSLRHMAVSPNDTVVIGAQLQATGTPGSPLLYAHNGENALAPLDGHPAPDKALSENYIASIAVTADGSRAISTAPRDGKASLWDLANRRWLYDIDIPDVAGACCLPDQQQALLSSGAGGLYQLDIASGSLQQTAQHNQRHWDNHLASAALTG